MSKDATQDNTQKKGRTVERGTLTRMSVEFNTKGTPAESDTPGGVGS